jgi:hypothetical protein
MADDIPTEDDWGDWKDDLDQKHAHGVYYEQSNEQMQERFVAAPVEAAEELRFMPSIPFQYYMMGFRDSVLSGKHDDLEAANAASCFIRLVHTKLKNNRNHIIPIVGSLMPALEYVAENQEIFGADLDIFGDFDELLGEIKAELAS